MAGYSGPLWSFLIILGGIAIAVGVYDGLNGTYDKYGTYYPPDSTLGFGFGLAGVLLVAGGVVAYRRDRGKLGKVSAGGSTLENTPKNLVYGPGGNQAPLFVDGFTRRRLVWVFLIFGFIMFLGGQAVYRTYTTPDLWRYGIDSGENLIGGGFFIVGGAAAIVWLTLWTRRIEFYESGFMITHQFRQPDLSYSYASVRHVEVASEETVTRYSYGGRGGGYQYPWITISFSEDWADYPPIEVHDNPMNRELGLRLGDWLEKKLGPQVVATEEERERENENEAFQEEREAERRREKYREEHPELVQEKEEEPDGSNLSQ